MSHWMWHDIDFKFLGTIYFLFFSYQVLITCEIQFFPSIFNIFLSPQSKFEFMVYLFVQKVYQNKHIIFSTFNLL